MGADKENELKERLVNEGWYVVRAAGSFDIDLVAYKDNTFIGIEVKSSHDTTCYLSEATDEKEQFENHISTSKRYGFDLFYAYRYISYKQFEKWHFYKLPKDKQDVELEQTEKSYKLQWDGLVPYNDWLGDIDGDR